MKTKKIIMIILDVVVILLALYFVLGYVNFKRIGNDKKPIAMLKEEVYNMDDDVIYVYDGIIYKIVKYEFSNKDISLDLKLWFEKVVE